MQEVTLDELRDAANTAREVVWEYAHDYRRYPKIYLHWTAGHYNQKFDDYHVNITGDGKLWLSAPLDEILQHTYKRNSGAVGIALCCAYGATTNDLGDEPPTAAQIESAAQAIDVIADALWLTIRKDIVMTHGEAAANEDGIHPHEAYAPWNDECHDGQIRWDLEYLGTAESPRYNPWATDGTRGGDVLRGKALWYQNKRKGEL